MSLQARNTNSMVPSSTRPSSGTAQKRYGPILEWQTTDTCIFLCTCIFVANLDAMFRANQKDYREGSATRRCSENATRGLRNDFTGNDLFPRAFHSRHQALVIRQVNRPHCPRMPQSRAPICQKIRRGLARRCTGPAEQPFQAIPVVLSREERGLPIVAALNELQGNTGNGQTRDPRHAPTRARKGL